MPSLLGYEGHAGCSVSAAANVPYFAAWGPKGWSGKERLEGNLWVPGPESLRILVRRRPASPNCFLLWAGRRLEMHTLDPKPYAWLKITLPTPSQVPTFAEATNGIRSAGIP